MMYHFIFKLFFSLHSNINRHEFVSITPVDLHGESIVWSLKRVRCHCHHLVDLILSSSSSFFLVLDKKKDETVNSISLLSRLMTFQVANDLMLRLYTKNSSWSNFLGNYFNCNQLMNVKRMFFFIKTKQMLVFF